MINVNDIIPKLERFGITDKNEQAMFLAQADFESTGFTKLTEGTRYRFGRAKVIWPSRKNVIQAKQTELKAKDDDFCPQPWLFNTVYGSRMGNELNGVLDDDGFDNRGMGIFQLTGYQNRMDFLDKAHSLGYCLDLTIDNLNPWLLTDNGAIFSAIWFWVDKKCGVPAKKGDFKEVTRLINGGYTEYEKRVVVLNKYKKQMGI